MRRAVHLLQLGVVTFVELFARMLTGRGVGRFAAAAGGLWYRLDARRRARAHENLRVAFPDLSEAERAGLARRAFGQLLQVPLEVMTSARFLPDMAAVERRVAPLGDYEAFRQDVAAGAGGLIVAAHLGSWEVAARALLLAGVPARAVMRPLDNPYLNERIVGARGGERRVIGKRGAARQVLSTLRDRRWAALLADQNAGRHGVFVPFFGLAASTYALPAQLALRLGLPLYATACLRADRGPWTFDLHFRRILPPRPPSPRNPVPPAPAVPSPGTLPPNALPARGAALSAEQVLRAVSEAIEGWVRLAPAQYNWVHRRWRSRPPGEVAGPGLPAYARPPGPTPG